MKKILKNWSLFEILFFIISILILIFCFILGQDKNTLSLIVSILGIITVLCGAKGLVIAPIINIVYNVIYIVLSISQRYYGEVLIYIFIMIPLNIVTIISWLKNKSKENEDIVKVNRLTKKEYFYTIVVTILITIGFYFLLKALNTNELLISTISLTDTLLASYLMLRRSSNYAIAYIVNDIVLITLWSLTFKNNGTTYLPLVISFIIFLFNDIYGLINWKKMEKNQK